MKKHEFKTEKGEFVVVDYNYNTYRQDLYSFDVFLSKRVDVNSVVGSKVFRNGNWYLI